mgnify:CR=1 FL=1
MTISIKPTASGSTIEQDGSTILTVDGSDNVTVANDLTVSGTISGTGTSQWTTSGSNISYTTGNVGIGTSSPVSRLHISASTNASRTITIEDPGSGATSEIMSTASGGLPSLAFKTAGTERMRIDSSGRVLIGGTSWVGGGSTDSGLQIDMNTSTDATFGLIVRNGSNVESFIHKMNGSTYNTTGTFGSISDRRFKENIVDATSKLEEVKQLQVRNFNLIGEEEKYLGFIAQEIEQVFPNIVDTQAERTHEETDDDGNVTTVTTPEKKLVKTTVLIPILTKALQEAITKIEDLETRIQALESN